MKRKNKKDASPGLYERIYEERLSQRVADAEDEARRMEAYERTVHNWQSRRALRAFAAFVLIFALFAAAAFIAYKLLFVISDISVEGNTTYTADEIIAASGVKSGDNLYSFSSRTAERLMKKKCPYVKSLKVERAIPNRIKFTVEEEKAEFAAQIYGRYFIFSGELCVLEKDAPPEKIENLCMLKLPAVSSAVCGETVEFRDSFASDQVSATASALLSSSLAERIRSVDLSDLYSLKMNCDGKYLLDFGGYSDTALKLKVASKVLEDEMFNGENKANIDLSNTSKTTVTVDNTLKLD